ncbi:patatin-like phospholipase family protein [Legionella sp.]|uniref:patatin-like phospholipase family protein n=1 Tax=Legionella sp. TaxID=459 RepID=UPI003C9BA5F4
MTTKKKINLALQGGGAHGAFTWGVLDKFLEKELFVIDGISATSAGSMNAVVLAQGLLEGGNQGARQLLYEFWQAMSDFGKMFGITATSPVDIYLEPFLKSPLNFSMFNTIIGSLSPYQFNPINFHPIQEVLNTIIDIEKIKKQSNVKLFICATNVRTGKIRVFNEEELTLDAVLASACLPKLFHAVEIEGEFYWDGGYLGNPAIFPLIYNTKCRDILVVHTIPDFRENIPMTVAEIDMRLREISFNSSLMREMRAIAFVSQLINKGVIKKEFKHTLKKLNMHCIKADKSMSNFPLSTVYNPDWDFLITLRDLGRQKADKWLEKNYAAIGKKTTINFDDWL